MQENLITSFSNEKIKFITKLKDKTFRDKNGQFFIEGYREIYRSLQHNNLEYRSIFISRECFLGKNEENLINEFKKRKVPVYEMNRKLFEKISYRDRPDGLITVAKTPNNTYNFDNPPETSRVIIIEGVEKPGNLGTILRTAEGVGDCSVFVTDSKLDLFNPNIIRSSTGTIFTLPIYKCELIKLLAYLKKYKYKIAALTPEANKYYFSENLIGNIGFIFGSEQYGLTEDAKLHSDVNLSIPMNGSADSLNLAMSAGIILYESLRQIASKS
ncbi:MAG: RNA methyltransferase [Leptospiraceae bacterium]|nr:RNA methyltransferase [Leptospiraceae bacterium]